MKLYYSRASPFSRKVRAASILLGLDPQIELVEVDPYADPPELLQANPLGLVPTLVTEDGFAFFDSAMICEYLNAIARDLPIIPPAGAARWISLRLQALGDGIMKAAVLRRQLRIYGGVDDDQAMSRRQGAVVGRSLDILEACSLSRHADIGTISVACALGYLDLRYAQDPWREERPRLANWFEEISKQECMRLTFFDPQL